MDAPNCIGLGTGPDGAASRLRDLVQDGDVQVASEIMWIAYWELREPVEDSPIEGRLTGERDPFWRRCARLDHEDSNPRLAQDEEDTAEDAWQWVMTYRRCAGTDRADADCRSGQNCYVLGSLLHNSQVAGAFGGEGGPLGRR
jgi:hypothetical protein